MATAGGILILRAGEWQDLKVLTFFRNWLKRLLRRARKKVEARSQSKKEQIFNKPKIHFAQCYDDLKFVLGNERFQRWVETS